MTVEVSTRAEARERVLAEGTISMTQAAELFPRPHGRRKPLAWRTVERFCIGGKAGIRLDGARIKGEWHTSVPAIQRFLTALREAGRDRSLRQG